MEKGAETPMGKQPTRLPPELEKEVLAGAILVPLRKPRRLKTNAWTMEKDGKTVFLKEISHMPWLLRATYGRFLIKREMRVYQRLAGINGIPRLISKFGRHGFLTEHIPGVPLCRESTPLLPANFFHELDHLVNQLHEHGILHLDLGQRKNIMLRESDQQPVILDFGAAVGCGIPRPFFIILKFMLGWVDHRGVLMNKMRYSGKQLNERERKALKRMNLIRALWIFNRPTNPRQF